MKFRLLPLIAVVVAALSHGAQAAAPLAVPEPASALFALACFAPILLKRMRRS